MLRRHGLTPRKSWGQNFLHDPAVHRDIVTASGAREGKRIIEIGAGAGTLTAYLLESGARVWAIERDRDLCHVLREELGSHPQFRLFECNAVGFDYSQPEPGRPDAPAVVGNLPYQLTGPLLFNLLDHHATTGPWVVMVQREVAERLRAAPGSKVYGGISVVLGRVRQIELVRHVAPGAFLPPPRVDSSIIRLIPRASPRGEVGDPRAFRELVRAAFQRRRKTLGNALSGLAPKPHARRWIDAAGLDPGIRPERLGPEEFAALQRARERDPVPPSPDSVTPKQP